MSSDDGCLAEKSESKCNSIDSNILKASIYLLPSIITIANAENMQFQFFSYFFAQIFSLFCNLNSVKVLMTQYSQRSV